MAYQEATKHVIRILHFSPHGENDGIARYQEQYLSGMKDIATVENEFFHVSPLRLRHLPESERQKVLDQLRDELKAYDVLHVQHEFGLFGEQDFRQVMEVARDMGKKAVVTVHLSPGFAIKQPHLDGLGPHSVLHYLRQRRYRGKMMWRHIEPMTWADALLVHNDITAEALKTVGIDEKRIHKIIHPVYAYPEPPKTNVITQALHKQEGDIIYCTVGMMHRYKGIYDAVKALKYLPNNYKLAIVGGIHPLSEDLPMYNKVCDLISEWGLLDRVYIAGFIKDDNLFNAYIKECDICIFPYDGYYYAHLSSGSINLGFANDMPVVAYPTEGFKELAVAAEGAVILTETFAYYELARELKRIDIPKQKKMSRKYADKMAWPKMAKMLAGVYQTIVEQ